MQETPNSNKYIREYAQKDGYIGVILYWKFKDLYLFVNHEKSTVEQVLDLSEVEVLKTDKYQKLYKERNKYEGDDRERMYGALHESALKVFSTCVSSPEGLWTYDFCREVASFKGMMDFRALLNQDGVFNKSDVDSSHKKYLSKTMLGTGSTYEVLCGRMFKEEVPEDEIKQIIQDYLSLPDEWQYFNQGSEEMYHYISMLQHTTFSLQDKGKEKYLKEALEEPSFKEALKDNPNLYFLGNVLDKRVTNYAEQIKKYRDIIKIKRRLVDLDSKDHTEEEIKENEKTLEDFEKNILLIGFLKNEIKRAPDKMVKAKDYFNIE